MMNNDVKVILVASVGGSGAPVAGALKSLVPDRVYFLVSRDEPNSKGSAYMINDQIIDYGHERGPGLRYAKGCPNGENVQLISTAADDPDRTFSDCSKLIGDIQALYPNADIYVDYTGGTKSMSGGLLMAALGRGRISVQFMAGRRTDLEKVQSGTEKPKIMSADYVLAVREFSRIGSLMRVYDFGAALSVIEEFVKRNSVGKQKIDKAIKNQIESANIFLKIIDNWDRFNFLEAGRLARDDYESGGLAAESLESLGLLDPLLFLSNSSQESANWQKCADLWLNAKRCAVRGRYDDAIARVYRLTEASIQAQLWAKHRVPSPPPWEKVPAEIRDGTEGWHVQGSKGYKCAKLGLTRSIRFIEHLEPGNSFARKIGAGLDRYGIPPWTNKRNSSILAHGFKHLGALDWQECEAWVENHLCQFWCDVSHPQLPAALPDSIRVFR